MPLPGPGGLLGASPWAPSMTELVGRRPNGVVTAHIVSGTDLGLIPWKSGRGAAAVEPQVRKERAVCELLLPPQAVAG